MKRERKDDGRRFVDAAARCAKKKPAVAVKVGKKGGWSICCYVPYRGNIW